MNEQEMVSLIGELAVLVLAIGVALFVIGVLCLSLGVIHELKHTWERADAEADEIQQDIGKVTEKRNG